MANVCIAHGMDISELGGPTNRITAFAKSLRDEGFDIHLIVPKPKNKLPEDLEDVEICTVPIKSRGICNQVGRALLVSLKAKRITKENNAILQIEYSTLAGFATLIGCSEFILDMHDLSFCSPIYSDLPFSKIIQKFVYNMEKRAVHYASKIIVVSNPMKKFIMSEWKIPEDRIEVIPNGYFENKMRRYKEKYEETGDTVCFLGTLHPKLDVGKFIEVAKLLNVRNGILYIIGDGQIRKLIERKINEERLNNVIFTGRIPDEEAYSLVAKSQVAIFPETYSRHTAFSCPVKLFDYAAIGTAIVANSVSERCEIFKENDAALVSDTKNQDEFIENVRILLENEKLRKKISSNAKRLVKDFTWEQQGEKLVRMYEGLI